MDKLKSAFQRDKEGTQDLQNSSSTPRGVGQGSHLSKATTSTGGNTGGFVDQPTTQIPSGAGTGTTGISSTSHETGDSTGSAAIGQTSTYSSHTLRHGDAVGSIIDRSSRDPTTYKMPEHTFGQGTSASGEHSGSGVPPGAAGAAASAAFNKHNDQSTSNIPGAFPKETAHDTVTLPPVNRPVDYEAGRDVPESNQSGSGTGLTGGSGATSQPASTTETHRSGTLGKILGAVGLGGAATGAGVAASRSSHDRSHAVEDTPSQPTTVTGTDSYTAPTQSGPPPSHHRKESIPTTAYPAGPGSPSPIHSPVGGTRGAPDDTSRTSSSNVPYGTGATSYTIGGPTEGQESSHTGRNAGLAAAGVGAGAAALGAHEYGKDRGDTTGTTASSALPGTAQTTSSSTFPSSGQGLGSSSTPSTTQGTSGYSGGQTTGTTGYSAGPTSQTSSTQPEHHSSGYGTTAAAAGLGAGAGALGAHEYGKDRGDGIGGTTSSALPATAQTTSSSTYPSSGQGLGSSSIPSTTQGTSGYGSTQPTGAGYSTGPTSQTSNTQPEQQSTGYGKAAAAAGLGAGAGALGAHEYGKHRGDNTDTTTSSAFSGNQSSVPSASHNTTSSGLPQTTGTGFQHDSARSQPLTSSGPTSQLSSTERDDQSSGYGRTAAATGLGTGAGAAGASALHHNRQGDSTQQFADKPWQADQSQTQSSTATGTHLPIREKATHPPTATSTRDDSRTDPTKDDSHAGRNTALAGAAGVGAAGAYGAHEHSKHQAEQDAERRQKDLAEQEAARQKQYEKDQKAAEKLAHKEEKQHEKDLKKLEKQEKSHEKEIKKEEKEHQKVVAHQEKEQQKELDKEAEDRKRREKEAAGAAAGVGAGGAAYAAHKHHDDDHSDKAKLSSASDEHERNKLHKDPPEQKKPSLFRRIFKRRKNKDTGDSEEYSTDEEDDSHHGTAAAAGVGAVGAGAGAGLAGSSAAGHNQTYDSKPSYNPLSKDDPLASTTGTTGTPGTTGTTGTHSGVHDPTSTTHGTSSGTGIGSTTGTGTTGNNLPIDDVTGLPYDPAKDPAAAARLQAHDTVGHKILEKAEAKEAQQEAGGPAPLS
ncbi:hypothetical protein LTR84_012997 [Exophiala bonariae]|uniref:Uncharacterized protein n=1 Tax=Exophiala bonariae TaxID=1690606 RepID=A0AAV9NDK0_9EURO|nr:hypothetical protein LTR84_012997 [Exophiala bonariae]